MTMSIPPRPFDGTCQNPDCGNVLDRGEDYYGPVIRKGDNERRERFVCEDCFNGGDFDPAYDAPLPPVTW